MTVLKLTGFASSDGSSAMTSGGSEGGGICQRSCWSDIIGPESMIGSVSSSWSVAYHAMRDQVNSIVQG